VITFEQTGEGTPKDIAVTTDDADAELAKMKDALEDAEAEDMETWTSLENAAEVGGKWTYIIPGAEAGDVAEIFAMGGLGDLEDYLDELNRKAVEDAGL
jgi:hypothetical protein